MKIRHSQLAVGFGAALAIICAFGEVDSERVAYGAESNQKQTLTLEQPPARALPVLALRKKLESEKHADGSAKLAQVAVAGQIGGMPNPWGDTHPDFPWYADQASFFVLDAKVAKQFASHAKNHGGDVDCPFCRRLATKSVDAVAVVNLVGDDGKILKTGARELLNLKEGQSVVVRGSAELLGGSFVVINADGIYVKK